MIIDDNIDDLLAELDAFTTDLGDVTSATIQDIADELPNQLIAGLEAAGKNLNRPESKGLRGSIEASVRGTQLEIGMNYYGYFQIFGVNGESYTGATVLGIVAPNFADKGARDTFQFRKIKHPGITSSPNAAQQLLNIADTIAETILEQI